MPRIAVIGAGVFGAWTAWRLAEQGHHVTLVDAYGPANGRASSADHSRVIRAGYGADAIYTRWAIDSLRDWVWLAAATGETLFTKTGALFMGEPGNAYIRATLDTLAAAGARVEWLEPPAVAARFPQIAPKGFGEALFEPDAGALRARAAVQALVRFTSERHGVEVRRTRVEPLDEQRTRVEVAMGAGVHLDADAFVFAAGPWLPQLFPQAIGGRIRATRQEVLYFGVPPGDARFSPPALPVWIDFAAGLYGIPDLDSRGAKVGIDRHGPSIDPDTTDRIVDEGTVKATRAWLARRFPALQSAPLLDSRVCQYENTSSGNFLIDRHPAWDNVWLVGGGSGHGFKHGPAVGRYVAGLIKGERAPEPRFALASKTVASARSVF